MSSSTSPICWDSSKLPAMSDDLAGNMVITMSIWNAGNLDWLQHGACTGSCTTDSMHTVSNIKVTTATGKAAARAEAFWNGEDAFESNKKVMIDTV